MHCLGLKIGLTKIKKKYDTNFRVNGRGAQFLSTLLETEGLWVLVSLVSLPCVLEQGTFILS